MPLGTEEVLSQAWEMAGDFERQVLLGGGPVGCTTYYADHGDTFKAWAPVMLLNSPFAGSASRTDVTQASTEIQTSYKFGSHGVSLGGTSEEKQAAAIGRSDGHSGGWYALATFIKQHYKIEGRTADCGTTGTWNYWGIQEIHEYRDADLTGASRETDADNLLRPAFADGNPVMNVDYRFTGPTQAERCVGATAQPPTFNRSSLYTVSLSVEVAGKGTVFGYSSARTVGSDYTYTLAPGSCYLIQEMRGGGYAFEWTGFDSSVKPQLADVRWDAPRLRGCDGPDVLEIAGPFDTDIYGLYARAQDVTYLKVEGMPEVSEWIPSKGVHSDGEFDRFRLTATKATFEKGESDNDDFFDFESTGSATIDYELPDNFANPDTDFKKFRLPPCGEGIPLSDGGTCIPAPWGNDKFLRTQLTAEWQSWFQAPPPPQQMCTALSDEAGVVLPAVSQAWTVTGSASFRGIEVPSATDTIHVQVSPGFSPP